MEQHRPSTRQDTMERPATSHGEGRKVTFTGDQRISQPSHNGSRSGDSYQDEVEEMNALKAAEEAGGKKWGFSLGNRTFRRNK